VLPRRYVWLIVVPVGLIVAGTAGFTLIEGWSLLDSLYVTVITLSTVGYGDLAPKSAAGRVFTIFLVLGGVFTLFYAAAEVIRAIVSGEVRAIFGRQRMERSLAELKDHLIICGYGRMGRFVCKEFETRRLPFVVIDHDPDALADFDLEHGIALAGDATSDEVLRHAGVERARYLVTVVASDADNLYVTMSARLLNDKLFIVARAEDEEAETKMKRAGANRVVCPYSISGNRVAQAVLRPTVVDFIELATRTEHLELQIEEMAVSPRGRLAGITLQESGLRRERGIIVMAIKKPDGKMVYNPFGETRLEAGDILIALGNRKQLDEFDKLASG
jgi:voltage-gated potassium channel